MKRLVTIYQRDDGLCIAKFPDGTESNPLYPEQMWNLCEDVLGLVLPTKKPLPGMARRGKEVKPWR